MKSWVLYSLLRVGIFAAAFAVLLLIGAAPWLAAIIAAIIGFCVSYLFLSKPRDEVARDLYERRNRDAERSPKTADEEAEDAADTNR